MVIVLWMLQCKHELVTRSLELNEKFEREKWFQLSSWVNNGIVSYQSTTMEIISHSGIVPMECPKFRTRCRSIDWLLITINASWLCNGMKHAKFEAFIHFDVIVSTNLMISLKKCMWCICWSYRSNCIVTAHFRMFCNLIKIYATPVALSTRFSVRMICCENCY